MTPYQSRPYARHVAVIPAGKLCDSIAIVFLSIEVRIRHCLLSRGQAQNGVNFDFEVKFDLEGQGQSPPKTIGILTKVFYTYGPNLVTLALMGNELSRLVTDGQTDAGNDNNKKDTKFGSQNFGHQIWFCTRLISFVKYTINI